ncbi:unnamed protein product [Rotaria sp. Silwood1]|nr:unnamed protein product [Rotaria sp. Silwood1]
MAPNKLSAVDYVILVILLLSSAVIGAIFGFFKSNKNSAQEFLLAAGLNIWVSVISIGVICTFYSSVGGMKAVIWTDVLQSIVMFVGLLAVIIQGLISLGGFKRTFSIASRGGRIEFDSADPRTRHTIWSLIIGGSINALATYGFNQAQVQRYMCIRSTRSAKQALFMNAVGSALIVFLSTLIGVIIYAYYADCDPYTTKKLQEIDQILPYFVMEVLGDKKGLPGVFLACIFSGSLSTISSGLNSLAAVLVEDVYKGLLGAQITKRQMTSVILPLSIANCTDITNSTLTNWTTSTTIPTFLNTKGSISSPDQKTAEFTLRSTVDLLTTEMSISYSNETAYSTQNNNQEELIYKTTSSKHRQLSVPYNFILIWLNSSVNEYDNQYNDLMTQFQRITKSIRLFTDVDQCIEFMRNIEDDKVLIILSNNIDMTYVPLINDLHQVDSIYIFSNEEIKPEQSLLEYKKLKSLSSSDPALIGTYNNIALAYCSMNDYLRAIPFYKKALKIQQLVCPVNDLSIATTCINIGRAHAIREYYSFARDSYQEALKIQENVLDPNDLRLAETYNNIGEMHRLTGNCSAALQYFEKTLQIQEKSLASNHPSLIKTKRDIDQVRNSMKNIGKIISFLETVLKLKSKSFLSNDTSFNLSDDNMTTTLEESYQYEDMALEPSQTINTIAHSINPNHSPAEVFQEYDNECTTTFNSEKQREKKIDKQWTYPVLLILPSLEKSPLYSVLKVITNGCLMSPILIDECNDKLKSYQQIKELILEVSSISVSERDRMLTEISSFDNIQSIYLLGKPPETKQQRNEFFNRFDKVCIFCDDEEQIAVQWVLDTANHCRISANQYIKAGDKAVASEHFQRGIELYDRLKDFIKSTQRQVS